MSEIGKRFRLNSCHYWDCNLFRALKVLIADEKASKEVFTSKDVEEGLVGQVKIEDIETGKDDKVKGVIIVIL